MIASHIIGALTWPHHASVPDLLPFPGLSMKAVDGRWDYFAGNVCVSSWAAVDGEKTARRISYLHPDYVVAVDEIESDRAPDACFTQTVMPRKSVGKNDRIVTHAVPV